MIHFLAALNYALVLLYGILLTVSFAGGCASKKDRRAVAVLFLLILTAQMTCYVLFGLEMTKKLYPLFCHLPLFLLLTQNLKKPWGMAVASVLTAYFCCQLPRWLGALSLYLFGTQMAYQLGYMISIFPLFVILRRYLAKSAYQAMTYSKKSLLLFGGLPLFYYLFDYATTVYTDILYQGVKMICEFLPAAMALFYVAFVAAYHNEMQRRGQLELDNAMLATQSQQARCEIDALQQVQLQAAVYSHDMRHHLSLLGSWLETGDYGKAAEYIRQVQADIVSIVPIRYCENNAVNFYFGLLHSQSKGSGRYHKRFNEYSGKIAVSGDRAMRTSFKRPGERGCCRCTGRGAADSAHKLPTP